MTGGYRPELGLGFEMVSSTFLDGLADRDNVVRVDFGEEGKAFIISVEDMIADRMG